MIFTCYRCSRFCLSLRKWQISKRPYTNAAKYPHSLRNLNSNNNENESKKNNLGALFLLSIPISAFLLGSWQVKRRQWKQDLIATLESRTNSKPVELSQSLAEIEKPESEFRPFKARGKFNHSKEILIVTRTDLTGRFSVPGGYLITPFKLSDKDLTILVNRGFVPYTKYSDLNRDAYVVSNEVEITGLLRFNEIPNTFTPTNDYTKPDWYHRDIDKMSHVLETSPIFIDLTEKCTLNRQVGPIGGQTNINMRNEHLSYIITWYTLCAITSFMWLKNYYKILFRK